MQLESYKQLIVWQRSIELVKEIYKVTEEFPKLELYGLVSQMRRSAVSIPSNIAEGYKRKNLGEYVQFLSIADASAAELETQLIISKDLYKQIDFLKAMSLLEEVQKMLITLIKKLNPKPSTLNPNNGFTVVELLVSMSLFSIIVGIASGVFIQSMRAQRAVVALSAAVSNAQLTIEQMAREIRIGENFSLSGGELNFTNAKGESIIYRLGAEKIERGVNGNFGPLTAENVSVKNLGFVLSGNLPDDGRPPKITLIMQIGTKGSQVENSMINLQVSVSSRVLDG